jgi:hypothetical protein
MVLLWEVELYLVVYGAVAQKSKSCILDGKDIAKQ